MSNQRVGQGGRGRPRKGRSGNFGEIVVALELGGAEVFGGSFLGDFEAVLGVLVGPFLEIGVDWNASRWLRSTLIDIDD